VNRNPGKARQFVEEGLRKEIRNPLEGVMAGLYSEERGFGKRSRSVFKRFKKQLRFRR
jgi:hypothetical protein